MTTTMNDIAEAMGVSTMTVSRALTNKRGVSDSLRRQILSTAESLGYFRNTFSDNAETTLKLGILVSELEDYTYGILSGIYNVAETVKCDLVIHLPQNQREDPDQVVAELSRSGIHGLIYVTGYKLHRQQDLIPLLSRGFPCVLINQDPISPEILSITITDYQGAYDATKYLLQLGHRRIAFIAGPSDEAGSAKRYRGYKDAINQAGVSLDESLVIPGNFNAIGGEKAAMELLSRSERPTAIFAASDNMARGAIQACDRLGIRIPDDVSLIGFDDIRTASQTNPPLTTVKQPLRQIGQAAMRLALSAIRRENNVYGLILQTSLVLRNSCAPYHID
jgi:LacI family transcriptional regulator